MGQPGRPEVGLPGSAGIREVSPSTSPGSSPRSSGGRPSQRGAARPAGLRRRAAPAAAGRAAPAARASVRTAAAGWAVARRAQPPGHQQRAGREAGRRSRQPGAGAVEEPDDPAAHPHRSASGLTPSRAAAGPPGAAPLAGTRPRCRRCAPGHRPRWPAGDRGSGRGQLVDRALQGSLHRQGAGGHPAGESADRQQGSQQAAVGADSRGQGRRAEQGAQQDPGRPPATRPAGNGERSRGADERTRPGRQRRQDEPQVDGFVGRPVRRRASRLAIGWSPGWPGGMSAGVAATGRGHTVTSGPQVGQGRLTDAGDLAELVDGAEPAVRGRQSRIRWASTGPMPGSASSCSSVAVLRSTGAAARTARCCAPGVPAAPARAGQRRRRHQRRRGGPPRPARRRRAGRARLTLAGSPRGWPADGRHGVGDPRARRQLHQPGRSHGAHDVHHDSRPAVAVAAATGPALDEPATRSPAPPVHRAGRSPADSGAPPAGPGPGRAARAAGRARSSRRRRRPRPAPGRARRPTARPAGATAARAGAPAAGRHAASRARP